MQNEKTSVLVLAQCDLTMRETLNTRFGKQCAFTFAENGEHPTAEQLRAAAVIFGEPSVAQLAQTENLRLLQLTWAGADKYTRMENLPQSVVLANASGAFGTPVRSARSSRSTRLAVWWRCTARLDGTGATNRRISGKNTTMRRRFPARPRLYSAWATSARMWPAD